MPGLGLLVPGGKRTGSERNQGSLSRPTTMTSPALRPSPRIAPNETLSPLAKNTKIVGTNSTSRVESTKPQENELKTNSKWTGKDAEISTVTVRFRPNEANSIRVSLPPPLPNGLKQIGRAEKDVKTVGTNSTSLLESTKRRKNELKTNSKWSQRSCNKEKSTNDPAVFTKPRKHCANRLALTFRSVR